MSELLLRGEGSLAQAPAWLQAQFPLVHTVVVLASPSAAQTELGQNFLRQLGAQFPTRIIPVRGELLTHEKLSVLGGTLGPEPFDLLVTLGGGTLIDAGKYLLHERALRIPHVAIPTTAGTGSEVTAFAAFYLDGVKQSLESPGLLPAAAILDPALLKSLPKKAATASAVDALTQAVEAYWSLKTTPEAQAHALEAIQNIWPNLEAYLKQDPEAAAAVQWGSHLSGKAIQIARTTLAHSLSYPLTGRLGVDHGLAVFLMLPTVAAYNALTPGLEPLWQALGAQDGFAAANLLLSHAEKLGISMNLKDYGVTPEFVPQWLSEALASTRALNNPRPADAATLAALIQERISA